MKKINIIFNKKDALLKVKDESMTITTSDNELIKIPYSSIKTYKYDEEEEILNPYEFINNYMTERKEISENINNLLQEIQTIMKKDI